MMTFQFSHSWHVHVCLLQGDQNSPGIIPLAIKDVFSMIQDVSKRLYGPGVEFFQLHFPVALQHFVVSKSSDFSSEMFPIMTIWMIIPIFFHSDSRAGVPT